MPGTIDDHFHLSEEQRQFFLEHGFVKIPGCFSRETAEAYTSTIWTRLGASPTDKSTWPTQKLNMPGHTLVKVEDFAPKAYDAICDVIGGEDRWTDWCKDWKDGFIVNFGSPDMTPDMDLDVRTLDNWHNDGDWFTHFLDSPEQALLVIPLFSDIKPKGGGTVICTDGIKLVAQELYDHPDGMTPFMMPRGTPEIPKENPERRKVWNSWVQNPELTRGETFHEATGEVGDVYLLHPFMLHSASRNLLRNVRIITNPPVALKEPFNYNRKDPSEYSLVEQKTLRDLGRPEGLPEWKITAPRERITPARVGMQAELKRKEMERLKAQGLAVNNIAGARVLEGQYPS
ncbi:hypothetical protein NA57DRAFT_65969 [Rhizodiscina lignyota]|uniref:Phytanoyl-CoA dioxygenase n=1 Tax=Rhizodiscina lignyota TaxID=1504668 RepID=A0A9P4IFU3_9PEZI|nr:hypothetical protein NA57DRAFT_65969 [Rhizodiscina lignyota]